MRAAILIGVLGLAACSGGEPDLLTLRSDGPDEFAVLPNRSLETPPDLSALPPPGGASRSVIDPRAEAIAALGGDARARATGAVPASDAALVAGASRYGRADGIRERLAGEDLAFRRSNDARVLERMFGQNIYFRAYRGQALDPYAELERFRAAGVRTVAAPPPDAQ